MNQYNHYLYVEKEGKSERMANGDYVASEPTWEFLSMCREETNGRGSTVNTEDMKFYHFSSLVQIPVGVAKVNEGTRVLVSSIELNDEDLKDQESINGLFDDGTIRIISTCAKYDIGRLHNRMWL